MFPTIYDKEAATLPISRVSNPDFHQLNSTNFDLRVPITKNVTDVIRQAMVNKVWISLMNKVSKV